MPITPIRAEDRVVVPAPIEDVWAVVADVARYPRWWPPSVTARVVRGAPGPVGVEVELQRPGGQPFRCTVESVDPPRGMVMRYHGRTIEGAGAWRLAPVEGGTEVTYTLDVVAHGWVVAVLSRVMSLEEAHSGPMRDVLGRLADLQAGPLAARVRAGQ